MNRTTAMVLYRISIVATLVATLAWNPGSARGATDHSAGSQMAKAPATQASFHPVPLPDPGVAGFHFPEAEVTIDNWVTQGNEDSIHSHTWGIWTALTTDSGETYEGQHLRVFETWYTPNDIQALPAGQRSMELLRSTPREPRQLGVPHQLQGKAGAAAEAGGGRRTVLGFVKYDPSAAAHVVQQDLFSKTTLDSLLADGEVDVPDFPSTAMTLKPVFQPLPPAKAVDGRYFQLAAWPGPPETPKAYPSTDWGQCVWIDLKDDGAGTGTGAVDTTCAADGSSRTADTTYGVGSFIHFKLTSAQAAMAMRAASAQGLEMTVSANDYAVLVGMHVTSREITRWTWQTFWWSANPDTPNAPSSSAIAAKRPSQLQGAARHYAGCSAFQMLDPNQPVTGGSNTGGSLYCFNPWLEAGFDPSDLPASEPVTNDGKVVVNNVGVRTNCMSCHAMAAWEKEGTDLTNVLYTGDRYVDLDGPQFHGRLRLDFLWSIAAAASP